MKQACQKCKKEFQLLPEDLAFYEKMEVPPPTWCFSCRLQRKQAYYVDLFTPKMFRRKCDATGKQLVSMYSKACKFPVYDRKYWHSEKWNPLDYGRAYDFKRPFFEQLSELMNEVPRFHVFNLDSEECDYSKAATRSKHCYLSTGLDNENMMYSTATNSKDNVDCWYNDQCEIAYFSLFGANNYNVHFSQYATMCSDSAFLYNCVNVSNSFGCINLKNKEYHIFNKPYSKEEYQKKMKEFDLGSHEVLKDVQKEFQKLRANTPVKYSFIINSEDSTGNNLRTCDNAKNCYDGIGLSNTKHVVLSGGNLKDSYDCYDAGFDGELLYESIMTGGESNNIKFSILVAWANSEIEYSDLCTSSSDLFGCVGLTNESFCILNKKYSKTEYEKMVKKIKKQMDDMPYKDSAGRVYKYGEFMPAELSPLSYQDSVANTFFPRDKIQAENQGFYWAEHEEAARATTLAFADLPDHVKDADDKIADEIIEDVNGHPYRIVHEEIAFYKKHNLALPRLCPECRYQQRVELIGKPKLRTKQCDCAGVGDDMDRYKNTSSHFHGKNSCPNRFATALQKDHDGPIYCEQCFEKELIN